MKNIIGSYTLNKHVIFDGNGKFIATSSFIQGELIYSTEGYLSVLINFKSNPETVKDTLCYSGKYKIVSDNEIIHQISICNRISRNNSEELRNFIISENILTLSIYKNDIKDFEAVWIRNN